MLLSILCVKESKYVSKQNIALYSASRYK